MTRSLTIIFLTIAVLMALKVESVAQIGGVIEGVVSLPTEGPAHNVSVMLVQLDRVVKTDDEGRYHFKNVPAGTYDIVAYLSPLASDTYLVQVTTGGTHDLNIRLAISPIKQEITVTATGREQLSFEAVPSVMTLDSFDMAERMATSIGEVLEGELGVAKRSFGAGSSRPVVRGFDGDRILIMEDGIRVGSLGSTSSDHGEPIDASNIERLEVVKGPATLLYGSNAIGGVVNAISRHHEIQQRPHQGFSGHLSSSLGSGNGQAGGSVNAEYGFSKWLIWFGGGGQRTADYDSPVGAIKNSKSRISNGSAGFGWFGEKTFASIGYKGNNGRYGIPFAQDFHASEPAHEELDGIDAAMTRHRIEFNGGFRNLGTIIDAFRLSLNYTDWRHDELEIVRGGEQIIGTTLTNRQFIYRGTFEHARRGVLEGSFGFWGLAREYEATGKEALSPPVTQNAFALFALEELNLDRVQLQLGGRVEYTSYKPRGLAEQGHGHTGHRHEVDKHGGEQGREERASSELVRLPNRSFLGFSSGLGVRFDLWTGGAFVVNYTNSYRSPALGELYNFGLHVGNMAFEIGDPDLNLERSNGLDISLRQRTNRFRGEANFFCYDIENFVFAAATEEFVDGLREFEYRQGASRFLGTELKVDVELHEDLWLNLAMDMVDTKIKGTNRSLPRIPPLRGKLSLDIRHGNLSFKPEIIMADARNDVFNTETPTPGYTVVNMKTSYTILQQHFAHHLSVNVFNIGDRLYRNHLSPIKDLAPEIGRGIAFSYVLKYF